MQNETSNQSKELWVRMAAIYGHRWVSAYGETDTTGTWGAGLQGLTDRHIADGLNACLHSGEEWPPSLPKFRNMCLGLTDKDSIMEKIVARDSSDPIAKGIMQRIGSFDMQRMTHKELAKRVSGLYPLVAKEVQKQKVPLISHEGI